VRRRRLNTHFVPLARCALRWMVVLCLAAGGCGRSDKAKSEGAQTPPATASAPAPAPASAAARGQVAKVDHRLRRASACSLISASEISAIVGAPIGPAVGADSAEKTSCAYPPADAGSRAQAEVEIEWDHGDAESFGQQ